MKKFTIIALALCMGFMLAAPVMAVDADFSGSYRVRGAYTEHWDLSDTSANNAFMNMRFRLQTVFKASDILSVTARFDALDGAVWGDDVQTAGNDDLDFDRAYMTIKAPIGTFTIGRQKGGTWGTTFIDTEANADRIKYAKVMDNLTLLAIFEKAEENDSATGTAPTGGATTAGDEDGDRDVDNYYLTGTYKMENVTAGVLFVFTNDKDTVDEVRHQYGAIPYFVSKFGPLSVQGELRYNWGETDYDAAGTADLDIKELAYNLEASFNFGAASVLAGYAFTSGDNDAAAGNADNEDSAFGHVGGDWEKLFILTTNEVPALADLGGIGNLSNASNYGAKVLYGGVSFSPLDNLALGLVVGTATAAEMPAGSTKDDYGLEYDLTLNWKIYDNLTYTAIAAFLEAGDFWWEAQGYSAEPATFDDTYALFHQLQLTF